jgi:hypothetical protein
MKWIYSFSEITMIFTERMKRQVQITNRHRSSRSETYEYVFATFLTPLRSHCLIPLKYIIKKIIWQFSYYPL